ncbi:MAG: hypothetical protein ACSLEW_11220 [Nocardioides sp.]
MSKHHPSCLARTDVEADCICRRRFPRKTLVGLLVAGVLAVSGVAFALYLLNAGVTGNVTTRSATYAWSATPTPTGAGSAATCTVGTPTTPFQNLPNISVSGHPGDECTITASLKLNTGQENFRVNGLALTGLPTGWTSALVGPSCGATLDMGGSTTSVSFKITVGPSGSGPITGGVTLAPVSQVGTGALTC